MTTSPRAEGPTPAIAGRSIPGRVFSTIFAIASSAPVLPAVTTPAAWPCATASMARRMEEVRLRRAAVGFISLAIESGVWRSVLAAATRLCFASSGASCASSPTSRKRAVGWRSAAISSPSMTMPGAWSPPMASTASVNGSLNGSCRPWRGAPGSGPDRRLHRIAGCRHFAAVVMAAMRADVMRPLELAAVRALAVGRGRQRLVAATHAAPRRRRFSLRNSHERTPIFDRPARSWASSGRSSCSRYADRGV